MGRFMLVGIYVFISVAWIPYARAQSRDVIIAQGPVRGYRDQETGTYGFQSIPYATAPTGTQKFKAPFPPPVWTETFEAVERNVHCAQAFRPELPIVMDYEVNCLIANVFTPDSDEQNLSVVVYFHGGGFQSGFSQMLPLVQLVSEQNVIVVTANYRVSLPGFLCLGTEDIPGNAGLKDQVAALRWVQNNIARFGGNPNDVTIAGFSAGATSVDLIMLSEAFTGLYNKVITDSGSNLAVFAVQQDPLETAKWFARSLNFFDVDNILALERFYKTLPNDLLFSNAFLGRPDLTFVFAPCVEHGNGSDVIFNRAPIEIFRSGEYRKVPMLIGFADKEGQLNIGVFDNWKDGMNENFADYLPADLTFNTETERNQIATQVKEFYFGNNLVSEETILSYIDYYTDCMFAFPTLRSIKYHLEAGNNQIFLYEFSFVDDNTPYIPHTNVKGADHCAQTVALAGGFHPNPTDEYIAVSIKVREMWGSFIKTGQPVNVGSSLPTWLPVRADLTPHMSIGNEVELRGPLLEENMRFWDDIYSRYYRVPQPVPDFGFEHKIVNIAQGPVRGYKEPSTSTYSFLNIPYATAPTGSDKFKAPLPAPVWTEPLEAHDRGITCPQAWRADIPIIIDYEVNCLIANVITPDTEEQNLPVVIYFHGGGFQSGFGDMLQLRLIAAEHNVISITFNYRLGAQGFLCLGTEDIPGNAGLRDQIALLRWVKNNIANFGGNPDDVTIAGFSAGAASVDLLMLLKPYEGLFNKVITDGGSTVAGYMIQRDPLEVARWFATSLNYTGLLDMYSLEQFYKTAPFDLLNSPPAPFLFRTDFTFVFSPCIEQVVEGREIIIEKSPVEILQSGDYRKVPILTGFIDKEGQLYLSQFETWKYEMTERFADFLPVDLVFESEEERYKAANEIKQFYFGNDPVSDESILSYIDYITDSLFAYPASRSVRYHLEGGNDRIYFYEYSFVDENTPYIPYTNVKGANHNDQVVAVSGDGLLRPILNKTQEFIEASARVRGLWANFIKTGQPVNEGSSLPAWPPIGAGLTPYMSISSELELRGPLRPEAIQLWDDMYFRYYDYPQPAPGYGINPKIVNIAQGFVRGYQDPATGTYSYQSIPYATAPTGIQKFKAPLPPPVWADTFEAVNKNIHCAQAFRPELPIVMDYEVNCLIANVFTPDSDEQNLSVVVYFHGGGFQSGFSQMLPLVQLVSEQNVIVVTANYRVSLPGFLCLGTEDIPGNAGLKDQVAALRWVQNNIARFGGNPNDVTIAGFSAGATSVDLIMLSEAFTGLYNKVITDSGSNLAVFAVQQDPLETAKWFARSLNFFDVDNILALERFYKTLPNDLLFSNAFLGRPDLTFVFAPCVEHGNGSDVIFNRAPIEIFRSGEYRKVPMLIGFADKEGQLNIGVFDNWKDGMNENFADYLPADLTFDTETERNQIATQVKEFYFGNNLVSEETVLSYIDYYTDCMFAFPTLRSIKYHLEAGNNQIFLYEYSFVDDNTPYIPHTNVKGADHCAQTVALAGGFHPNPTDEYVAVSIKVRELWGSFIKTGQPVNAGSSLPTWLPVGADLTPHMSIGNEVELRGPLLEENMRFWDDIYSRYYRVPQPVPDFGFEPKVVNIAQGPVRGYKEPSTGTYGYLSIPFATAPTGTNKFKAPLPPPVWTVPFEAINREIHCPQAFRAEMPVIIDYEVNCLIANVFTPDIEEQNLPVVIYFHGGAFQSGFGEMLPLRLLVAQHNVIAITANYRLGVQGYLCLGTEDIPGNAGLKDQLAVLRWVKQNIASFGGNPDDVTIAGFSAGAASVDILMLSQVAEGLFNKVIVDSGSNLGVYVTQSDPLENAKWFARTLNFTNVDNLFALEQFYKSLSPELLFSTPFLGRPELTFVFSPCIENQHGGEVVLDRSPVDILRSGNYKKVPILYGFADKEGQLNILEFDNWKGGMNENFADYLPDDLIFETEEERSQVANQIKQFYFGNELVSDATVLGFIDYYTDCMFAYPALRSIKYHLEAGNDQIYFYEYSFVDDNTPYIRNTTVKGADHVTQTIAVSGVGVVRPILNITEDFIHTSNQVREMWANFIKTGQPVTAASSLPAWPPIGADLTPHMSIGNELELRGPLLEESIRFWDDIYSKYYRAPIAAPGFDIKSKDLLLAQGPIRGYKDPETGAYEFLSIPYATAPTGVNKFKAPLPPPVWTQTFEAVNRNIFCPQVIAPGIPVAIDFDINCLIANIVVPDTDEQNLPVIVYFHGGGFQIGFGAMLPLRHLAAEQNIITITANYRLGLQGYLCLGTEDIPGNAGLKDQSAVLRWVKNNIASFGGNPEDVTIAGFSAGASSVDLLMLSEPLNGLFNRIIPDSGTNTAVYAVQSDPLENAKWFARNLNFTNVDNIYALEHFYKTLSFDLLYSDAFAGRYDLTFVFSPCVERAHGGEVIIDRPPLEILESGDYRKVPLLYGFADKEGLLYIDYFDTWQHGMNERFSDFLPADLQFESDAERDQVAQQIKQYYFGDQPVGSETVLNYIDYYTDVMFAYPLFRGTKLHLEAGNDQIYVYEYSFVDDNTPYIPHTNIKGADHCAQTIAVSGVGVAIGITNPTDEFVYMSAKVREMWANFVKTGSPVPEGSSLPAWPPIGADLTPHMSIGNELELRGPLLEERVRFWEDIYSRHYREKLVAPGRFTRCPVT